MQKFKYFFFSAFFILNQKIFAEDSTNILGMSNEKLKSGDITFDDIPKAIQSATSFILGFAATIAMIMVIVGALKYSLGSVEGNAPNKQNAQNTIKYGIFGMLVAVSAWFIVNLIISNL